MLSGSSADTIFIMKKIWPHGGATKKSQRKMFSWFIIKKREREDFTAVALDLIQIKCTSSQTSEWKRYVLAAVVLKKTGNATWHLVVFANYVSCQYNVPRVFAQFGFVHHNHCGPGTLNLQCTSRRMRRARGTNIIANRGEHNIWNHSVLV